MNSGPAANFSTLKHIRATRTAGRNKPDDKAQSQPESESLSSLNSEKREEKRNTDGNPGRERKNLKQQKVKEHDGN